MIRIRHALTLAGRSGSRFVSWWSGLEPAERVLYRAVGLSAIGFGLVALPLAFIVPSVLFALTFFGFGFRRGA